ncbi:MAG: Fe-S cluster assembly protein SufD [Candidatus Marinimicrobia bacterium]|nr:Fe-S cluster assembly protein SufD [Candidatus Neomarinimicrobiota bacterium]MBT4361307.1 Fe-S cluster assembly protein SufD [Candidatus Neomarinimicrobiota bacterium]MBT4947936.1 Fe-S cluster assembly protein SufD [Candidatus Neomarinimicrobiota bacterium]MBT5268126.1 Fe-S cluster assembly protein SufD [Candidatus Neomarinimicrobiota bacterium]MBT6011005.1 Fe-S cluster assembly protein SufD [Candidatus Neomarinimicrobiota bacterium]
MAHLTNNFSEWVNQQVDGDSPFAFSEALRSASLSKLATGVFPTRKDEEWKYTPLADLFDSKPGEETAGVLDTEFIRSLKQAMPSAHTIVFLNGEYSEEYSDSRAMLEDSGLSISRLPQLEGTALKLAEDTILKSTLTDDNIFQHIALGLSQNGLFIEVKKNVECQTPIHVIYISTARGVTAFTSPVNVIRVSSNSHLKVVEQYASLGEATVITVPASYVQLEDGAGLDYYKIGMENAKTNHICNTSVRVAGSGTFRSHQYLLGSNLTRSNLEVSFTGPGAEAVLRGVYLGDEKQHLDVRTYLDHAHPHCSSDQHFRGILNGHSRGVFNGLVLVREHAQKTDAQQSNKNLLLSRDARIDTKPQLEIFADDVKCTHGATVGELDSDALFYLQSRGIDQKDATLMLTRAFAAEVTQEIDIDSLRTYVQGKIAASLDEIVIPSV